MARAQRVTRVWLSVAVILMVAAAASAQTAQPVTAKDLVGVWDGAAQTPNGDVTLKVEFTLTDGKLSATIESSMGTMPVSSVTLTGDQLAMEIEVMGSSASLAAKATANRIEGSWSLGAESGPFTLAKAASTDQAPKK